MLVQGYPAVQQLFYELPCYSKAMLLIGICGDHGPDCNHRVNSSGI